MAWRGKKLALIFFLICDLDTGAGIMKSVATCAFAAFVYNVVLNYLEKIRSYGPNKERPCFNFDIDF